MLFQTLEFLILLLAVMLGIACLRAARWQHLFLLIASYVFYAWWDVRFLCLMIFSSTVDYAAALGIAGIRLSRGQLVRLGATLTAAALLLLGIDWPAIQHGSAAVDLSTLFSPDWPGHSLAMALGFAVGAPLAYALIVRMSETQRRRMFLVVSLGVNLGVLGFFKYSSFFLDSLSGAGRWLGYEPNLPLLAIALPVGISFYTFQAMSYTIDVYRRQIEPERSMLRFQLFVAYFPQLVAGPIIRPQEFLPHLDRPWKLHADRLTRGAHLCLVGLAKKILIADSISPLVDAILNAPAGRPSLAIQLAVALFAVQIYCDFSGYTDIARGVSRIFGIDLPLNFDYPYFATSVASFWRRWHISLSTWLRDYLYIPIGGNRGTPLRVNANLMTTMVLGGLWHGASWNFILWGAYQGLLLTANRGMTAAIDARPRLKSWCESPLGTVLRWGATMYCVLFGWLLFRVTRFEDLAIAARAFLIPDGRLSLASYGLGAASPVTAVLAFALFVVAHSLGYLLHCIDRNRGPESGLPLVPGGRRWSDWLDLCPQPVASLVYVLSGAIFFFGWPSAAAPFIYFQF